MDLLANDYPGKIWDTHKPPCLSLYQPTHRHHPQNQQDPIRFQNLVKALQESLQQQYPSHEIQPLLEPFRALADDYAFWQHTLDGLAVLGTPELFRVYRLQRPVPELAIVAASFHTKPLLRLLQSADRYQILGLSRQEVRLFEGNRDVLDEVELAPAVPRTITEALGQELTEPHQTVASYGMGAGGPAMHHSHGSKKDEVDKDTERFFRVIDREILKCHSQPSGLPLILAALPEHQGLFRQLTHNPFLMAEGIEGNPTAFSNDALRNRAWQVLEPHYVARLTQLIEEFGEAHSKGLGAEDLAQIAAATVAGRVATLLIEADRQIPGRMIETTGQILFDDLAHPEVGDLLDDLGEGVLKKGGQVVVVPSERMPTKTGVAATYRF